MLSFAFAAADNIVHGAEHSVQKPHAHEYADFSGPAFDDHHDTHHPHESQPQAPDELAGYGDPVGIGHHHHGDGPTGFVGQAGQPDVALVELSNSLFRRSDDPPPRMAGGRLERPPKSLTRIV